MLDFVLTAANGTCTRGSGRWTDTGWKKTPTGGSRTGQLIRYFHVFEVARWALPRTVTAFYLQAFCITNISNYGPAFKSKQQHTHVVPAAIRTKCAREMTNYASDPARRPAGRRPAAFTTEGVYARHAGAGMNHCRPVITVRPLQRLPSSQAPSE